MDLHIETLMIEASRKCNMKCRHCLRGAPQRKIIDNKYVYKLFNLIDGIGTINIGGGEPTLAMDTLEYVLQCIRYSSCDVGSFYVVTNGKAINVERFAQWVWEMYTACSDNEMSSIGFSFDSYHRETLNWAQCEKQDRNFENLADRLMYEYGIDGRECGGDFIHKHSDKSWSDTSLYKQGRAKDFGCKETTIMMFEESEYSDTIHFSETELYLSSTGALVAGCDWSYHNIDHKKDIQIGHLDNINCQSDLIEAIQKYNKTREEKEAVASPE